MEGADSVVYMLHGIKANKFTRRAFLRRLLLFLAGRFVFTLKGENCECDSHETPLQVAETPFLSLVFGTPVQGAFFSRSGPKLEKSTVCN